MTKIKAWLVAISALSAISYVTLNGIRLSSEAIQSVKQNTKVELAEPKKGWLTTLKEKIDSISSLSESIGISTPSASPVASSDTSPDTSPTISPVASPAPPTPFPSLFPSSIPLPSSLPSPIIYPKLAITDSVTTMGINTRIGFKDIPSRITITANQPLLQCRVRVQTVNVRGDFRFFATGDKNGEISGNVCVADWSNEINQDRITDWYSYSVTGIDGEIFSSCRRRTKSKAC